MANSATPPAVGAVKPFVLCILDGWGERRARDNNAIALAHTPTWDRLRATCPMARLQASATDVGLPEGQGGMVCINSGAGGAEGSSGSISMKTDGGFRSVLEWRDTNEALVGHCESIGRDPSEIFRTVHIPWESGADPSQLRDEAAAFGEVGVDQVIFNMQGPPSTAQVEKLGVELDMKVHWDTIYLYGSAPSAKLLESLNLIAETVVRPKFEEMGVLNFENLATDGDIDWRELEKPLEASAAG